jgi:formylglycine-generating enzyme required for sulfatase activity
MDLERLVHGYEQMRQVPGCLIASLISFAILAIRGHRGGSWYSDWDALRSASRNRNFATTPFDFIGFRVARTLEAE